MTKAIITIPNQPAHPLGQVLDRPFLQHLVEQLVHRGVGNFELLVPKDYTAVLALLGDGTRWGVRMEYRVMDDNSGWSTIVNGSFACTDDLVLVGNASHLPYLPEFGAAGSLDGPWPAIYFDEYNSRTRWTGWVLLRQRDLLQFATHLSQGTDWRRALREEALQVQHIFLDNQGLSCASDRDLLLANRAALEGQFPGLFFQGKEVQPGVWVARAVKIRDSVRYHAPCYIGEESWIGANCELGPYAVVGPRCVVARGTSVSRSIVAESTYVGPELEVTDSIVQHSRIHNVRLDSEIDIPDRHIVCNLTPSKWW